LACFRACFWASPPGSGALTLPGLRFRGLPPGGPEGASRRGPKKRALLGLFLGLFWGSWALPGALGGRGPWVLPASGREGPKSGPILALFWGPFSACFRLPFGGPIFPLCFRPRPARGPKRAIFSAPFWPLLGLFFGPFPGFGPLYPVLPGFLWLPGGSLPGPCRFWAPKGALLGPFWGPGPAPPGPLIFPLCFGWPAFGRPKPAQKGPKRGPFGALLGPLWAPLLAGSGRFPLFWRAKSVVGFGAPKGPSGPLLSLSPSGGSSGRFWPVFGLFSARFGGLFWSSVLACFCPVGCGLVPLFGSVSASFWSLFGLFFGPLRGPKSTSISAGFASSSGFSR